MEFIPDDGEPPFDPVVQALADEAFGAPAGIFGVLQEYGVEYFPVELRGVMSLLEMTYDMASERFAAFLTAHGVTY